MGHPAEARVDVFHTPELALALERATSRIAPTWPLDSFIAVNPLWGFVDAPLPDVAARLAALSGSRLTMPRSWYRASWRAGRMTASHVRAALNEGDSALTVDQVISSLDAEPVSPAPRARVTDVIDATWTSECGLLWSARVTHNLSQFCAAWFDEGQASFGPSRGDGLYATWRRGAFGDPLLARAGGRERVQALPKDARSLVSAALSGLEVPAEAWEDYLTALLLDINGWAAWCAYRRWTARLDGSDDDDILELLAMRLAWEWVLHGIGGPTIAARWCEAVADWPARDADARAAHAEDWVLQRALELAYREDLVRQLPAGLAAEPVPDPQVQAVFCIDVRSEVFRRALEVESPSVQTLGFAGFFGLPIDYRPTGAVAARPQLPGLLAPRLRATDTGLRPEVAARRIRWSDRRAVWKRFKHGATSGFSFVEATGLLYGIKLLTDTLGLTRPTPAPERAGLSLAEDASRHPEITSVVGGGPLALADRCDLAAGILRSMSLTRGFARLVAFVGHGSRTVNNPFAAGLDCGACCGHTGEVNARAAVALMNDPAVREGLEARGIRVPPTTWFVAGLHDTTTDDVSLFDPDALPTSHRSDLAELRTCLAAAGNRARAERAPGLGLAETEPAGLRRAITFRARDWAQVRPEWGLANNAAFVAAPREHCRHLDLRGRSFLHEYRWQDDRDFTVLESILTAPVVVAHWINFQYYASTVDNLRWGSGNKVLHNVVGGGIGVFEGNGGDLRIGLPMQSLHDGENLAHTPLRLCVIIEAPQAAIDEVLRKHVTVRHLVENGWVHLLQLDEVERTVNAWNRSAWVPAG